MAPGSAQIHGKPLAVLPGDVLLGKYRVDRVLGEGGMGTVVAAHHLQLDDRVAIKFLRRELLAHPEAVARFEREARAAVKIRSEHVARIMDVGRLETGEPYMVMEYLEGQDLAAYLHARGPLPVETAVDFVLQAAEALVEAHSLGIVHRDLKPANLFCDAHPSSGTHRIKLLDFGISKLACGVQGDCSMTQLTAILGSPNYMSPEQGQSSKSVDGRTDIWSLGVVLFELLAGRVPFAGDTLPEVCVAVATRPTPSLRAIRPDVPPELEMAVARCLEKDRDRRFPNILELCRVLAPFASAQGQRWAELARPVSRPSGVTLATTFSGVRTVAVEHAEPPPQRRDRSTGALVAVLLALLALFALLTVFAIFAVRGAGKKEASHASSPAATVAAAGMLTSQDPNGGVGMAPTPVPPDSGSVAELEAPKTAGGKPAARKNAGSGKSPSSASSATQPKALSANCDPNYTLDATGEKHFKPECF